MIVKIMLNLNLGGDKMSDYIAYCVRCKAKQPMKDVEIVTNAKGRRQAKGLCPKCGTKMNLFLKSEKLAEVK